MDKKTLELGVKKANMSLGKRIRYFRQKRGLTQKKLAQECEVVESTIRNYELGQRTPDHDTLTAIALALEISFYELADPAPTADFGCIHYLFALEDIYGLKPTETEEGFILELDKTNPYWITLQSSFNRWSEARRLYEEGSISAEDYIEWRERFPHAYDPVSNHPDFAPCWTEEDDAAYKEVYGFGLLDEDDFEDDFEDDYEDTLDDK